MAELKTQPTGASVGDFLAQLPDGQRQECAALAKLMTEVTGAGAEMWGEKIVGFGRYSYRYASGRTGEWMRLGFAPRKGALTVYVPSGVGALEEELGRLGKCKTGQGCIYLKRLADVDEGVLRELLERAFQNLPIGSTEQGADS